MDFEARIKELQRQIAKKPDDAELRRDLVRVREAYMVEREMRQSHVSGQKPCGASAETERRAGALVDAEQFKFEAELRMKAAENDHR